MGQHGSKTDFEWSYTDQPHASRRQQILKKHPEVKQLFGPDPWMAVWVVIIVACQLACMTTVSSFSWPLVVLLAYTLGGMLNHALMVAIHEISHNLVFGFRYPMCNKLIGIAANLPLVIPYSVSFKSYHSDHHRLQGYIQFDGTVPTRLEAALFNTTLGKTVWLFFHCYFYIFRPLVKAPKNPTNMALLNTVIQVSFNFIVLYFFGVKSFFYLAGGTVMMMGIHPMAGHFLGEHFVFSKGQETNSYYGPFNYVTFNVGYHIEHHDFPYVPASRLPKLKAMAPEFYDLPHHSSYLQVIYDFITDPEIGLYARIIRDSSCKKTALIGNSREKEE